MNIQHHFQVHLILILCVCMYVCVYICYILFVYEFSSLSTNLASILLVKAIQFTIFALLTENQKSTSFSLLFVFFFFSITYLHKIDVLVVVVNSVRVYDFFCHLLTTCRLITALYIHIYSPCSSFIQIN